MKKRVTDWGISTLIGLAFGLAAGYYVSRYQVGRPSIEIYLWSVALSLAIVHSIGALGALSQSLLRPRLETLSPTRRLWLEVPASVTAHILGFAIPTLLGYRLLGFPLKSFFASFGTFLVVFLIIHESEYLVRFYRELKNAEVREERLKALATRAELRALRAQINPHFLFNTLNTIAALTHTDPVQAEALIERMAEMFRYVLAGSERGLVPLEEELAFVESYLEIERARFGDQLRITREVAPGVPDVLVPSLVLQPLVENVLRHGRGSDGSVDVSIRVQTTGNEVVIAVTDQGPGMPPRFRIGEGPGHGLHNVDERLRNTYGEGHGLQIRDSDPHGTVVAVRIPTEVVSA